MLRKFSLLFTLILAIFLILYSTFWYYKANSIKSDIYNIINKNQNLSVNNVAISGYFSDKKVTISGLTISLPQKITAGNIIIGKLQLKYSSEDEKFKLVEIKNINFRHFDGAISNITPNKDIDMKLTLLNRGSYQLNYKDNGHKLSTSISDKVKSIDSLILNIAHNVNGSEVLTNIRLNISNNLVNLLNIYKNSLADYLIKNIENNELTISNNVDNNLEDIDNLALQQDFQDVVLDSEINEEVIFLNENELAALNQDLLDEDKLQNSIFDKINDSNNNILLDITLKTISSNNMTASDPTKLVAKNISQSKFIEINNFSLTNDNYKITLSGSLRNFADDNKLSGELNLAIHDYKILSSYIKESAQILIDEQSQLATNSEINNVDIKNNKYNLFLKKVKNNIDDVMMNIRGDNKIANDLAQEIIDLKPEISKENELLENGTEAKNSDYNINREISDILWYQENYPEKYQQYLIKLEESSKNLILKIHREKNLEYMINDRPIRDIIQSF